MPSMSATERYIVIVGHAEKNFIGVQDDPR